MKFYGTSTSTTDWGRPLEDAKLLMTRDGRLGLYLDYGLTEGSIIRAEAYSPTPAEWNLPLGTDLIDNIERIDSTDDLDIFNSVILTGRDDTSTPSYRSYKKMFIGHENSLADHDTRIKANATDIAQNAVDVAELQQADTRHHSAITDLQVQIQSLQIEGKVIPGRMVVEAPEEITLGNNEPQRITVQLLPDYVTQNVLFLGDDKAVSVDPATGELTVNGMGESIVHVIPTENVALTQKITIQVIHLSALLVSDDCVLFDVDNRIFTT
ncbi:MAG: hypothetical protein LUE10_00035 [Alistipes sp.]|nr:hypothetical protein [Alistipes sp.]